MKLLNQGESSFTFRIGKRERDLLIALLRRYPVLPAAHFRKRHPSSSPEVSSDDALLKEALEEQQQETRKRLEEWLEADRRFVEGDQGVTFSLSAAEMEWMLQVLNDIRVGSWLELGQPDGKSPPKVQLTEQNIQLAWALEMAGLFQHHLLEAAAGSG